VSTPAVAVSSWTRLEGLPPRLDAFAYAEAAPAPDGTKYAPFSSISPSDL